MNEQEIRQDFKNATNQYSTLYDDKRSIAFALVVIAHAIVAAGRIVALAIRGK